MADGDDDPPARRSLGPGDVITEAEAYARFGHVLEDKELRIARQRGRIGYLRRKRQIFYRADEVEAYVRAVLSEEYIACPEPRLPPLTPPPSPPSRAASGGTAATGSRRPPDPASGPAGGTTPRPGARTDAGRCAVEALKQLISKPPRTR
ncbi:hypothetical protein [Microvirga sp. VF16]|uniref:hypothetical protein n=1 Tax=Microvirga sp. VF16 TaxID=2807101 RepID=UPI00193E23FB|nr:hypothetical protein [Microvirga sp. VF16]QRM36029.1 hypothetical protein JO965_47585 [Microvirga sp. VF16]